MLAKIRARRGAVLIAGLPAAALGTPREEIALPSPPTLQCLTRTCAQTRWLRMRRPRGSMVRSEATLKQQCRMRRGRMDRTLHPTR